MVLVSISISALVLVPHLAMLMAYSRHCAQGSCLVGLWGAQPDPAVKGVLVLGWGDLDSSRGGPVSVP